MRNYCRISYARSGVEHCYASDLESRDQLWSREYSSPATEKETLEQIVDEGERKASSANEAFIPLNSHGSFRPSFR
jgi:hypothetical protein